MPLPTKDLSGGSTKRRKGTTLPTDPDKPKGARRAFVFFGTAERAKLKGSSPPSGLLDIDCALHSEGCGATHRCLGTI